MLSLNFTFIYDECTDGNYISDTDTDFDYYNECSDENYCLDTDTDTDYINECSDDNYCLDTDTDTDYDYYDECSDIAAN